jgi:hypothetical protein
MTAPIHPKRAFGHTAPKDFTGDDHEWERFHEVFIAYCGATSGKLEMLMTGAKDMGDGLITNDTVQIYETTIHPYVTSTQPHNCPRSSTTNSSLDAKGMLN